MCSKLPEHLSKLSKADLEGLCHRCGLCCYAAVKLDKSNGSVFIPELRCKHLSIVDNKSQCDVYSCRHAVTKGFCLPLEEAISKGTFPNNCPYVKGMPGYEGPVALSDETYNAIKPQLKKHVTQQGMPPWASKDDWDKFLK